MMRRVWLKNAVGRSEPRRGYKTVLLQGHKIHLNGPRNWKTLPLTNEAFDPVIEVVKGHKG